MIKKRYYKAIAYTAGVLAFLSCGFLYSCTADRSASYTIENDAVGTVYGTEFSEKAANGTASDAMGAATVDGTEAITSQTQATVFVYVCGNVVNPGVYEAAEDARVYELIDMAGGVTQDGCAEALNLAEHVFDGQKLYVPDYGEYDFTENIVNQTGTAGQGDGLVNINEAGIELLMTLPGIGKSRAQAIIDYRDSYGRFGSIEDIMQVSGIKESAFSKIKEYICVN